MPIKLHHAAAWGVLAAALAIPTSAESAPPPAATSIQQLRLQPGGPPNTFAVILTVTVQLASLHPAVTQAGLDCGAVGVDSTYSEQNVGDATLKADQQNGPQVSFNSGYDAFSRLVLSAAHYRNSEVKVDLPLTAGGYTGTRVVTMYVPNSSLVNSGTSVRYQWPGVIAGCWLTLNGTPALNAQPGEIASPNNYYHIVGRALAIAAQNVVSTS